ncbi:MAG: hypothetical protein WCC38_00350 [Pseudonocardiaceae bacterium]
MGARRRPVAHAVGDLADGGVLGGMISGKGRATSTAASGRNPEARHQCQARAV